MASIAQRRDAVNEIESRRPAERRGTAHAPSFAKRAVARNIRRAWPQLRESERTVLEAFHSRMWWSIAANAPRPMAPTVATLARDTHLADITIRVALRRLVNLRLLVPLTSRTGGRCKPTIYTFGESLLAGLLCPIRRKPYTPISYYGEKVFTSSVLASQEPQTSRVDVERITAETIAVFAEHFTAETGHDFTPAPSAVRTIRAWARVCGDEVVRAMRLHCDGLRNVDVEVIAGVAMDDRWPVLRQRLHGFIDRFNALRVQLHRNDRERAARDRDRKIAQAERAMSDADRHAHLVRLAHAFGKPAPACTATTAGTSARIGAKSADQRHGEGAISRQFSGLHNCHLSEPSSCLFNNLQPFQAAVSPSKALHDMTLATTGFRLQLCGAEAAQ